MEEYERARRYLEAMHRVKEHGVKVMNLQGLKQVAIENEDYETAKRIKEEIEKINGVIERLDIESGFPKNLAYAELQQELQDSRGKYNIHVSPPHSQFEDDIRFLEK